MLIDRSPTPTHRSKRRKLTPNDKTDPERRQHAIKSVLLLSPSPRQSRVSRCITRRHSQRQTERQESFSHADRHQRLSLTRKNIRIVFTPTYFPTNLVPGSLPICLSRTGRGYATPLAYRAEKKSWYVVARNFFLLLLTFYAWLCLGPA